VNEFELGLMVGVLLSDRRRHWRWTCVVEGGRGSWPLLD